MYSLGRTHLRNTGALLPGQFLRLPNEHVRGHGDVLCVRAAICETEDLIALLEVLPAAAFCAQLCNRARELDAEDLGRAGGHRVLAFSLQQVHAVQTECLDLDERLGLAELGLGHIGNMKGVDWALAVLDVWSMLGGLPREVRKGELADCLHCVTHLVFGFMVSQLE